MRCRHPLWGMGLQTPYTTGVSISFMVLSCSETGCQTIKPVTERNQFIPFQRCLCKCNRLDWNLKYQLLAFAMITAMLPARGEDEDKVRQPESENRESWETFDTGIKQQDSRVNYDYSSRCSK